MYLDKLCEMLDKVCDLDNEIYFLGGLNIDWNMLHCALKEKLQVTGAGIGGTARLFVPPLSGVMVIKW